MANTSRVNGFKPVKHLNGSPYNGQMNIYEVAAGDGALLNIGDLVVLSDQDSTSGYPAVERFGTSGAITSGFGVGVVVGFIVDPTRSLDIPTGNTRAASTKRFALVADSPDLIMEVQEDGAGGYIALASVGLNAGFDASVGSTTTGASGMTLDSSSVAATATLPLRLVGISKKVDNEQGQYCKWLVGWNLHQFAPTAVATGALGV